MRTSRAGGSVPEVGIFLGAAGIGSPALGTTTAPPQHGVSQQPLSLWHRAFKRSISLGPPHVSHVSHFLHFVHGAGLGSQHFGAGAGQHFGAGAGLHVSQQSFFLQSARNLSRHLGRPQLSQVAVQQAPLTGMAAGPVSPANRAVVTNKNAAFTRYTSKGLTGAQGGAVMVSSYQPAVSRFACALI
jgi:hypothetical protein